MRIGTYGIAAGIGISIVLIVPGLHGGRHIRAAELDLPGHPAAILVPTRGSLDIEHLQGLRSRGHAVIALSDTCIIDHRHRLVGVRPVESLLAELLEKTAGQAIGPGQQAAWRLPADARWEELSFAFISDEVVNVRFRGQTRRFEPSQLGMMRRNSGRPASVWTLLRSFAETSGRLAWGNRQSAPTVKKQKQILNDRLTAAFGIAEDAIAWVVRDGCYATQFQIRDSRPTSGEERRR
jgi:hypothetical protein